jgi:hypothetical protein
VNKDFNKLSATTLYHRGGKMPLTKKGEKIKRKMMKNYGKKKGKQVFYASERKGTIKGVVKGY